MQLGLINTVYKICTYILNIRLYKLERIFSQQVDLKSALDSKDFL